MADINGYTNFMGMTPAFLKDMAETLDTFSGEAEFLSLKSKFPIQNGCQKTYTQNFNQSVIVKNQQNSKWPLKN